MDEKTSRLLLLFQDLQSARMVCRNAAVTPRISSAYPLQLSSRQFSLNQTLKLRCSPPLTSSNLLAIHCHPIGIGVVIVLLLLLKIIVKTLRLRDRAVLMLYENRL